MSWSADGRFLVFQEWSVPSDWKVRFLRWPEDGGPPEPETLVRDATGGTLSPDGRWLAYASYQSGRNEIYVQEFPSGAHRRQVSTKGGLYPAWSPLGDELFYVRGYPFASMAVPPSTLTRPEPEFISVQVQAGSETKFGGERVLFSKVLHYGLWGMRFYDVAPDAQSFVVPGPDRGSAPSRIHVVLNWTKEIEQRLRAGA